MTYLTQDKSTTAALERIVRVLKAKLSDSIELNRDVGLKMPTPPDRSYYLPGRTREKIDFAQPILCIVEKTKPRKILKTESGTESVYCATIELPVRTAIFFGVGAYNPLDRTGHPQLESEFLRLKADRYSGAMADAICKYAIDGHVIDDIKPTTDDGKPYTAPNGLRGVAVVEWVITQTVTFPVPASHADPADVVL